LPLVNDAEKRNGAGTSELASYGGRLSDPLRRTVPTPHAIALRLMGKAVRLESNSPKMIDHALQFFAWYPRVSQRDPKHDHPDLRWRILTEPGELDWPGRPTSGFSDDDLSFVKFGARSFGAVDADTRSGIAFLAEGSAEVTEPRLAIRPPLEFLLYMTATSLGFTCLSAACVAFRERCVVLLGEPSSGKTSASYVATKLGLELVADHVVFLEPASSGILVWGDPFPTMFRPEALRFFPELRGQVRELSYEGVDFCFFDKSKLQSAQAHCVEPLCSVYLDRAVAAEPHLAPMQPTELVQHLATGLHFKGSDRFQSQEAAVFAGLAELPAYRLSYGEDPATAASIVRDLLRNTSGSGGR
jgi:hypothetical protein